LAPEGRLRACGRSAATLAWTRPSRAPSAASTARPRPSRGSEPAGQFILDRH